MPYRKLVVFYRKNDTEYIPALCGQTLWNTMFNLVPRVQKSWTFIIIGEEN